jgi:hypothetical protein
MADSEMARRVEMDRRARTVALTVSIAYVLVSEELPGKAAPYLTAPAGNPASWPSSGLTPSLKARAKNLCLVADRRHHPTPAWPRNLSYL